MLISEMLTQKSNDTPPDVVTCKTTDEVTTAIARMAEFNIGAVVVSDDGDVAGIFTERDVLNGVNRNGAQFLSSTLQDSMVRKVIVVGPERSVDEAIDLMNENRIRHLLVIDKDQLIGVLSMRDLLAQDLKRAKTTAEFLKQQVKIATKTLPM